MKPAENIQPLTKVSAFIVSHFRRKRNSKGVILNNIISKVPRMRTVPQIKKEYPELQMSTRLLYQLAKERKVVSVNAGKKILINIDSLFSFLNGEGA